MLDPEAILPVHNADWLVTTDGSEIVKVKSVYSMDGQVYMDIYLYDHHGVRLPRRSPVMGGPRTFEPSIEFHADQWLRVAKPKFPLNNTPRRMPGPGFQPVRITFLPELEVLPWRETPMKQRLVKVQKRGWTEEERKQVLKDASIRRLLSEADTLDNLVEGAFVVMSTDDIKGRARALRDQAAALETADANP